MGMNENFSMFILQNISLQTIFCLIKKLQVTKIYTTVYTKFTKSILKGNITTGKMEYQSLKQGWQKEALDRRIRASRKVLAFSHTDHLSPKVH